MKHDPHAILGVPGDDCFVVGSFALHAAGQDFSRKLQAAGRARFSASRMEKPEARMTPPAAINRRRTPPGRTLMAKPDPKAKARSKAKVEPEFVRRSDAEWRKDPDEAQYMVTRQKGNRTRILRRYATVCHFRGIFHCVCCDAKVFSALRNKFDSGTGWPSFDRPAKSGHVVRSDGLRCIATRGSKRWCAVAAVPIWPRSAGVGHG